MTTGPRIHQFVASVFSIGRASASSQPLTVERIHDEHADFVWRSLQRLGVRDSELEDTLQEVFIVVHRKLGTFDGSSRLSTWLYGICLRVASASRNRAHVRREQPMVEIEDSPDHTAAANPERAFETSEGRRHLAELLDKLAPQKRAVFVMFEIEGIPAVEIAEMIGVPVGTVHSRLSAARAEFTDAVKRSGLHERIRGAR